MKQHLQLKRKTTDKYNLSGVYVIKCKDFFQKYIGQRGRSFRTRYKEHMRNITTNGITSKYAQHILDTTHNYDNIDETMEIIYISKKSRMLDTLENIYGITKQEIQMNDAATGIYNPIYEFVNKYTKICQI
jgi:uncharacterized protein YbcI